MYGVLELNSAGKKIQSKKREAREDDDELGMTEVLLKHDGYYGVFKRQNAKVRRSPKGGPNEYSNSLVSEMWQYPNGALSTKNSPDMDWSPSVRRIEIEVFLACCHG